MVKVCKSSSILYYSIWLCRLNILTREREWCVNSKSFLTSQPSGIRTSSRMENEDYPKHKPRQNLTFAHDDIIYLILPRVLPHVSSTVLSALQGWTYTSCGPSPCVRHKICSMARFTTICGSNPSQTLWGSVAKKGRFVRENTGSGQTSGSVRTNQLQILNHTLG